VWANPEALKPTSMSFCQRRRAIGESAEALLVALTTKLTPARAALATTLSSWAGTPGLTSTTDVTPCIARSMLAGSPRSATAISAPIRTNALARSGSRVRTLTGISRPLRVRTASAPTFPAVVTRIMTSLP
jgi:hypothetical protein